MSSKSKMADLKTDPPAKPFVDPPEPKPKARKPKGPALLAVGELAKSTGRTLVHSVPLPARLVSNYEHAAASTLHGWAAHKHHAGQEMRLTADDYEKAIAAAKSPPRGQQRLVAHPAAVSPHCPHAFAQEK